MERLMQPMTNPPSVTLTIYIPRGAERSWQMHAKQEFLVPFARGIPACLPPSQRIDEGLCLPAYAPWGRPNTPSTTGVEKSSQPTFNIQVATRAGTADPDQSDDEVIECK
jgi:hypothetical protein